MTTKPPSPAAAAAAATTTSLRQPPFASGATLARLTDRLDAGRWAKLSREAGNLSRNPPDDCLFPKLERLVKSSHRARNGDVFALEMMAQVLENAEDFLNSIYNLTGPGQSIDMRPEVQEVVVTVIKRIAAQRQILKGVKNLEKAN